MSTPEKDSWASKGNGTLVAAQTVLVEMVGYFACINYIHFVSHDIKF